MFDFFKKSRAFKFLCSACLLCSLGAFAKVYAQDTNPVTTDASGTSDPETVGYLYFKANLGMGDKEIRFDNAKAEADMDGILSGELKYYVSEKPERYSKGEDTNISLDQALYNTLTDPNLNDEKKEQILTAFGFIKNGQAWTEPSYSYYPGRDSSFEEAWVNVSYLRPYINAGTFSYNSAYDDQIKRNVLEIAGWSRKEAVAEETKKIYNPDENAKLALFLTLEDEYKAATKEIDLAENNDGSDSNPFELTGIQLYDVDAPSKIEDESTATKFSGPPGKYAVNAIVTKEGSTSIINSPVADDSDESA